MLFLLPIYNNYRTFFDDYFHKREMWHYFEERIRSKFSLLMAFEKQTILFGKFKIKEICIDHNTCTYGLNFFLPVDIRMF